MGSEKTKERKSFSFAFIAATVLAGVAAVLNGFVIFVLARHGLLRTEVLLALAFGFASGVFFLFPIRKTPLPSDYSGMRRFQTLIHELKHAVVVVLSGNKLSGVKLYLSPEEAASAGTPGRRGSTYHATYKSKRRFRPFITLAPYFFPLLSLPVLIVTQLPFISGSSLLLFLLGATLGVDSGLARLEYKKSQQDFKRILGGRRTSIVFLAGFHAAWLSFAVLSTAANGHGYLLFAEILARGIVAV